MLSKLIDQFYIDNFKDRGQDKFYITDSSKCPRALYFKFKKYPKKDPEPRALRIFDNGDYTHMRIVNVLFGLGIIRAVEIKIPPQEIIAGRADAIIDIDGKPYVLEIKSIASYKFQRLQEPESDHIKQIQLYMHYFKIPDGILLYEDKDKQTLQDFFVKYDPFVTQEVLNNFKKLKTQISQDVLPDIPSDIESWRCDYCEYSDECMKLRSQESQEQIKKTTPLI